MRRLFLIFLCIAPLTILGGYALKAQQPNIILILADDAGYADFGFQGSSEMKTPNLDSLAETGIRFEQAYVTAAVCGPSRAGLLTGKYQQRFGFEENNVPGYMSQGGLMGDEMGLPLDEVTLADYLKKLGYETALIGKWHQGNADRYHPTKRGFDHFYGFRGGARSYLPFDAQNPVSRLEDRLEEGFGTYAEPQEYLTDAFAEKAVSFLSQPREQPFFLYLAFNAVHTPMEARVEDLAHFPQLSGKRQQLAAMTLALDRACGKVFQALAQKGLTENTLIIFTNDNGGPSDANASSNLPLSGTKANHLEGGIRVPMLMNWPAKFPTPFSYPYPVSMLDMVPTLISASGHIAEDSAGLNGVNLLPFLSEQNQTRPHKVLYWKKENRATIRVGDWKMLRFPDRPAQLYYLPDDVSEQHDLASQYPERVRQMYKQLFEWELTLDRPHWQLKREYEGAAMKRMDAYH